MKFVVSKKVMFSLHTVIGSTTGDDPYTEAVWRQLKRPWERADLFSDGSSAIPNTLLENRYRFEARK